MVYRKGELSKSAIDQGWPYQVAVEARQCTGDQYMTKHTFCMDLSLCSRGHAFRRDNTDYVVYCFAEREHAEMFQQRFGGEMHDASGAALVANLN